ncbi:hypothetical protein [Promicromonospora sp. MEB111]|uniref:hypothetical protein n=1 Tax=Promicromonospora sp. MEB111 TaxID=3040301 RepID=UPI00254D3DB7|nr:hypothetical protein [Promicromonospora sp. MEB111]
MTNTLKVSGTLLTASAEDRTLTYRLVKYGEPGRTSKGIVTARRGSIKLPADVTTLFGNYQHDQDRRLSRAETITEDAEGLLLTANALPTPAGDELLAEALAGARPGVSVELENPAIRAGELLAGELIGFGHVVKPAYPSSLLTAADTGELDDQDEDDDEDQDDEDDDAGDEPATQTTDAGDAPETTDTGEATMTASNKRPAKRPTFQGVKPRVEDAKPDVLTANEVFTLLGTSAEEGTPALVAALTQVTQAGVFDVVHQPQWLGELWDGVDYEPEYTPLIGSAPLTSMKMQGFTLTAKPQGGTYAGNGAEVPSSAVTAGMKEKNADRWAGGWNVDRVHVDFPSPEFWAAFWRAVNDDYAQDTDAKVRTYLTTAANASPLVIPAASIPATVPEALFKLVRGVRHLKRTLKAGKATFAIFGEDLYDDWLFLTSDSAPQYVQAQLNALSGLTDGIEIIGDAAVGAGVVRVGTRNTAKLHQLGGATPIRVSTQDVAHGNMTEAAFAYDGIMENSKVGLVAVTTGA